MNYKFVGDIIGLDLGASRTGVARLNTIARIAEPLSEIDMKQKDFIEKVKTIVEDNSACAVVAGLPKGLEGQVTEQTLWSQELIKTLENGLEVPVFAIDEAGTTKKAETRAHPNESVDSVAAGILLEDFASEVLAGRIENASF